MEHQERIWFVDPATLRDMVVDKDAMEARLEDCTDLERVWVLSLLGRGEEAVNEAQQLLATSTDPFRALLVLAYAYQRLYRWRALPRCRNGPSALHARNSGKPRSAIRSGVGFSTRVSTSRPRPSSSGLLTCSKPPDVPAPPSPPTERGNVH